MCNVCHKLTLPPGKTDVKLEMTQAVILAVDFIHAGELARLSIEKHRILSELKFQVSN